MSGKRYTAEFMAEAIRQALTPGRSTWEVTDRLGLNKHSLYRWIQQARLHGELPGLAPSRHSMSVTYLQSCFPPIGLHRMEVAKRAYMREMVARGGIEPPTRGFSVRCSTN